ncbi:hypothetical protein MXM33_04670 [Acinetobacter vivianii]|uniref:hypothetical protein n=1 Tax=Acinetobacter vivianii TaxID=1776742 RepID=UPI002DBDD2BE|nr:hypothetical protein [Acinetobacter vivianii]MEB6666319.1 hypothetical protein [Acinetobacter vivianii]
MSKPVLFSVHEINFEAKRFSKDHDEPVQPINIWSLFKIISKYNFFDYSYPLSENTLISKLKLIEFDDKNKFIKLLVVISDTKARNRSYTDTTTGKTRLTNKKKSEGDDARVHVVIKMNKDNLTAIMAIERERGSRINHNLLRILLDRSFDFIYENNKDKKEIIDLFSEDHPSGFKEDDGSFTRLPKKIKCNIENVFSDEVLNAFKQGKISDLELIHTSQVTKTDQHSSFVRKFSSFHFEVDPLIIPDKVTEPKEIQKTIIGKISTLWNDTFGKETPIPLDQHKYRISYKDDYGKISTYTYTPAEALDMTLAKTIQIDPKTFTHIEWKELPEINSSLCSRAYTKL